MPEETKTAPIITPQIVRVRFAPSPTGFLHIGGVRTALFNWLFARHHQGKFILRIEDTDIVRSKKIYLNQILEDLKWLGLNWDEGPYFQSEQLHLYQEYAQKLLQENLAFAEGKAIILKTPAQDYEFSDLIRGPIKFGAGSFKDQVLIKSDGTPTYNFACCIDDHQMRISHVIRGDDHISNTPKQLAIYAALKFPLPQFAHIPLIVAQDRSRLSKRKGAMPLSYYRKQGYLPEALFNFLALLGWSPDDASEVLTREEIVRRFSLEGVGKAAAYFNPEKLDWMNGQYIQQLDQKILAEMLFSFLSKKEARFLKDYNQQQRVKIAELFQPRIKRLAEFPEYADFFFQERIEFSPEAKQALHPDEKTKTLLNKLSTALANLESFDTPTIEQAVRQLISEEGIKAGELIHPVRAALTGKNAGPGLFETIAVLGKEKVLKRLYQAIELMGE